MLMPGQAMGVWSVTVKRNGRELAFDPVVAPDATWARFAAECRYMVSEVRLACEDSAIYPDDVILVTPCI